MQISGVLSPQEAFTSRVFAFMIDAGLVVMIYLAATSLGASTNSAVVGVIVLIVLYLGIIQGITGYTLGKICTGVVVVKEGTYEPPSLLVHLARTGVLLIETGIIPFGILVLLDRSALAILVLLILATGDQAITSSHTKRERFGDRWLHTQVIGFSLSHSTRSIVGIATGVSAIGLLAIFSVPLTLALLAIFGSMLVAIGWAAIAFKKRWSNWPWLVGAVLAFVPAVMMASIDICGTAGGTCPSPSTIDNYHLASVAVGVLIASAIIIMMFRSTISYVIFAVGVGFSEIWMILRLHDQPDLKFASYLLLFTLAGSIIYEGIRVKNSLIHNKNIDLSA